MIATITKERLGWIWVRSASKPINKKTMELTTNAKNSQKFVTVIFVVGDVFFMPILPTNIPAATTAKTPLTWNCSATMNEPNARATVVAVSMRWSSTFLSTTVDTR